MSKKLQEIINNIKTIQRSFTEPTSILITDTEQILVQVKADFDMEEAICPEDPAIVTNTSKGLIDNYVWKYDVFS